MLRPLTTCPTCNSKSIHRIVQDLHFENVKDIGAVTVKNITVDKCDDCGEIVLEPQAGKEIKRQIHILKENLAIAS